MGLNKAGLNSGVVVISSSRNSRILLYIVKLHLGIPEK